jgi:hypothetical protein
LAPVWRCGTACGASVASVVTSVFFNEIKSHAGSRCEDTCF